jgi:2-succinyl-5-enolpyruvyl-6-hydroxy-3-cyclohexene-1-carboxylate synthase
MLCAVSLAQGRAHDIRRAGCDRAVGSEIVNPSTALATVLVDALVLGGVRDVVLSPGSRSAPLAFALYDADAAERLRLHVRIDERSAGFLALGLAKVSRLPVPVVTTSGTAAVNLHPALVEASYAGVPLIAVTADRPEEMRGVGANQTIDQVRLFGGDVARFVDLPAADSTVGQVTAWRDTVAEALDAARGGPVHVNVSFREPLVPDRNAAWVESLDAAAPDRGSSESLASDTEGLVLESGPRTVVVAGDGAGSEPRLLAEAASWPLLAEPTSGSRSGPNALATYRVLLEHLGADVERVVVYGRPTLSRPVARLLARPDVEVVAVRCGSPRTQFRRRATVVTAAVHPAWVTTGTSRAEPDEWLARWLDSDAVARKVVAELAGEELSGVSVARTVGEALPQRSLLVVGSSASVRDLDLADPWDDPLDDAHRRVLANRGASGIDGTVSTAIGAALAHDRGPAYSLMGDLTFLHDSTGLVIGPDEPRPDLTIVVNNDDGGGIFGVLEQGAPEHAGAFERVFGTPHGVDIASLCAATGTPHSLVTTSDELRAALAPRAGIRVVEVRTDRTARRALDQRLREAVGQALGS